MTKAKATEEKTTNKGASKKKQTKKKTTPKRKTKCGKCRLIKANCKCGRPLFDGKKEKDVISKLEEAFKWGASDEQACVNADISIAAFYRYQSKNPKFRDRKQILKETPQLHAKQTIAQDVREDKNTAKWLLERKEKGSYSSHSTFSGEIASPETPTEEDEKEIAARVNSWMNKPEDLVVDEDI